MESCQPKLCISILLLSSLAGTGAQDPKSYSHREATTGALNRITHAFLESMHPAKNGTRPISPTFPPELLLYIDTVFRRHLGYGVPSTYLRYVEAVCDANEFMAHPQSNRQNSYFWHRYTIDGKLSMKISDRILGEWKAAAIDASYSYHEARVLIGQALHLVQDRHRLPGSQGLLSSSAINASVDFIPELAEKLDPASYWRLIGMRSPFRGRELVIVLDNTFRNETLPRLKALARWAADYVAANWTNDIPPKFSIHYPDGIRAVFPSTNGLQVMTSMMEEAVSDCENPNKPFCEPDGSQYINPRDPRRILRAVDAASRYSEVGSTIFFLADTRFTTDYRMHVPFLQKRQQQLVIIGNAPDDYKKTYSDFAGSTGGVALFSSNDEDEIYRSLGYLHHASKDNLVIAAGVDSSQELEKEFEIYLPDGDVAVGILIGRQDISVDLSSGTIRTYRGGQWINAPAGLSDVWKFRASGWKGWSLQVYVQSDDYYNMGLYKLSDWTFNNELSNLRPWEHKGYTKVEGNPVVDDFLTVLFTRPVCEDCDPETISTEIELFDMTHTLLGTYTVKIVDDYYYGADIRVPSKPFRIVVTEYMHAQHHKRYSKLFTPTQFAMTLTTGRPVEALPLQSRTAGTITINHPENFTVELLMKDSFRFLPSVTKTEQSKHFTKYAFNITVESPKFTEVVTFAVLSNNQYESADNFVLQQVTGIAAESPTPPTCRIVEQHGQCDACGKMYSAKMEIKDEYDGFLHNSQSEWFFSNWTASNGLTKVVPKRYLDEGGNVVGEVWVTDAECCETVRAFARDDNGEEGVACEFVSVLPETASASVLQVSWVFLLSVLIYELLNSA